MLTEKRFEEILKLLDEKKSITVRIHNWMRSMIPTILQSWP